MEKRVRKYCKYIESNMSTAVSILLNILSLYKYLRHFVIQKIVYLDTVRELLSRVPANAKSELPASASHTIAAELVGEYDLTPLHLAAYSGSEDVVRVLLNSSGVDVEGGCTPAVC